MTQVYIQPITQQTPAKENASELHQSTSPNVRIRLLPSNSTDEFTCETHLPLNYLSKVQKWLSKSKFTHTLLNNDLECELRVEIFKFHLTKVAKDEIQLLKQSIAAMRKQNQQLVGEQKMFRFYFFKIWKDRQHRQALMQERPELRQILIQNCYQSNNSSKAAGCHGLWDSIESVGMILEDFGAKNFHLAFSSNSNQSVNNINQDDATNQIGQQNEAMNNLYAWHQECTDSVAAACDQNPAHPASSNNGASLPNNIIPNSAGNPVNQVTTLEVFISGGCYEYKRATLEIAKMQVVNCQNSGTTTIGGSTANMMMTGNTAGCQGAQIIVRVDQHVQADQVYTVFVPKKLI